METLPVELHREICGHLAEAETGNSIRALGCTSRYFHQVAQDFAFYSISIAPSDPAQVDSLVTRLEALSPGMVRPKQLVLDIAPLLFSQDSRHRDLQTSFARFMELVSPTLVRLAVITYAYKPVDYSATIPIAKRIHQCFSDSTRFPCLQDLFLALPPGAGGSSAEGSTLLGLFPPSTRIHVAGSSISLFRLSRDILHKRSHIRWTFFPLFRNELEGCSSILSQIYRLYSNALESLPRDAVAKLSSYHHIAEYILPDDLIDWRGTADYWNGLEPAFVSKWGVSSQFFELKEVGYQSMEDLLNEWITTVPPCLL